MYIVDPHLSWLLYCIKWRLTFGWTYMYECTFFSFFNGKRVLLLVLHDMIYIFIVKQFMLMLGLKYSFNEIYS